MNRTAFPRARGEESAWAVETIRHRWLLLLIVVVWAVSWPVMRLGVASISPLWYAFYRYSIAAPVLFVMVAARGRVVIPSRADWPLVLVSGGLQMGVYSALVSFALVHLPPGRASVLAFSTPIWVAPLAAWRLSEKMSGRGWWGVALGVAGACLIAAPSLHDGTRAALLGYLALITAAMAWAISLVYVRSHRFATSALALAPWQCVVAMALLLPTAWSMEGEPPRIGIVAALSLCFVGPVATAFAYWAIVEVGSRIRATRMSMTLLATPPLGIALSAWLTHETVNRTLVGGFILIALGILLSLREPADTGSRATGAASSCGARRVSAGAESPRSFK